MAPAQPGKTLIATAAELVADNPAVTVPFAAARAELQVGDTLDVRLNRSGYEVRQYPVTFLGILTSAADHLFVFKMQDASVIVGHGDSGSPVLDSQGRVIAVLCYGVDGDRYQFMARAIDDVVAISQARSLSEAISAFTPLGLAAFSTVGRPWTLGTVPGPASVPALRSARASRSLLDGTTIPGQSVAVLLVSGPIVNEGWVGTLSFLQSGTGYLFGHSATGNLASSSPVALPVFSASMVTMLDSSPSPSKLAQVEGQPYLGNMVKDTFFGGLLDAHGTQSPPNIDVTIGGHLTGGTLTTARYRHLFVRGGPVGDDSLDLIDAALYPVIYEAMAQDWHSDAGTTLSVHISIPKPATSGQFFTADEVYSFDSTDEDLSVTALVNKVALEIYGFYLGAYDGSSLPPLLEDGFLPLQNPHSGVKVLPSSLTAAFTFGET